MYKKYYKEILIISTIIYSVAFIAQLLKNHFFLDNYLYFFYKPIYFIVYIVLGLPIFIDSYNSFKKGDFLNEKTLMFISTLVAYIIGAFEEASAVVLLYSIGEYIQENSLKKSRDMIDKLLNMYYRKDLEYKKDDICYIKKGQMFLNDCILLSDSARIDKSSITGENRAEKIYKNDKILAGSINLDDIIKVKIINDYSQSYISKINKMIEKSLNNKTRYDDFITKFSKIYTPIVIAMAILVLIIPPLFYQNINFEISLYKFTIFLIVSCPCALMLIIPITYNTVIKTLLAQNIFVKDINVFEKIEKIDKVYFDKTGTIILSNINVKEVVEHYKIKNLEKYIVSIEKLSNHELSMPIIQYFGSTNDIKINDINEIAGYGIIAKIDNNKILIGNDKLLNINNIFNNSENDKYFTKTNICFNKKHVMTIYFDYDIDDSCYETISYLNKKNIEQNILTGDNECITQKIAKRLKINNYYSNLDPIQKYEIIKNQNNALFIGDGINDALALSSAFVSICINKEQNDITKINSDVISNDVRSIKILMEISKKLKLILFENMFIIILVKAIVINMNLFGLATLWIAVFADIGIIFLALLNLKRIK